MTPLPNALLDENRVLRLQLAQAQGELNSFTQALGHDLRAPVRHIRAFAQIIEEDFGSTIPVDLALHLKTIGQSAEQLALMLDALVQLSAVSNAEFKPEPVELRPLVDAISNGLKGSALASKGASSVNTPSPAWHIATGLPTVLADRAMLTQVLQQLIANAVKFSALQAAAQIEVGWRASNAGQVEVFVKDNGVGFDPRFQGRLFGIFQRLHAADQFAGLGVGLAIASRLVQRHGGQIQAISAVGQGCEMRFTLPLARGKTELE